MEFGKWLDQKRKEKKLTNNDFSPIDAGTISRIVTGKTKVRFKTAHYICKRLDVSLIQFSKDFLGRSASYWEAGLMAREKINWPKVVSLAQKNIEREKNNSGKPRKRETPTQLGVNDVVALVRAYFQLDDIPNSKKGEAKLLVESLIGEMIARLVYTSIYRDFPSESTNLNDVRLLGELVLRGKSGLFSVELLQPISNTTLFQDHRLSFPNLNLPEDAFESLKKVVAVENEFKNKDPISIPTRFNKDRFLLDELLEICSQLTPDEGGRIFSLFWAAYEVDSFMQIKLDESNLKGNSSEPTPFEHVAYLLITLLRWSSYYKDEENVWKFQTAVATVRSLQKI